MFEPGFLGTKAPFFMDAVTLIVAALPFLVGIAIWFARKGSYLLHKLSQTVIFILSAIVVGYFEYGIHVGGGYEVFAQNTKVSPDYLLIVLIIHIFIAVVTMGIWAATLLLAYKASRQEGALPGSKSKVHKRSGIAASIGILLTSYTGVWVYMLLFIF